MTDASRARSRRQFILERLEAGDDAMSIWKAATVRFGHCGWNYTQRVQREWLAKRKDAA